MFERLFALGVLLEVMLKVVSDGLIQVINGSLYLLLYIGHILLCLVKVISDCFVLLVKFPECVIFEQGSFLVSLVVIIDLIHYRSDLLGLIVHLVIYVIHVCDELFIEGVVLLIELSSVLLYLVVQFVRSFLQSFAFFK
jgi:hypothetical protein